MIRSGAPSDTAASGVVNHPLSTRLRAILEQFPDLVPNPEALARRLAPALSDTRLLAADSIASPPPVSAADPLEAHVLAVVRRHPSGRTPGLAPDALAHLTGLAGAPLARAVSALVQAGALVRDAWLVRLPQVDDLLPQAVQQGGAEAAHDDAVPDFERRAIGDRRSVGERRLYDRRTLHGDE